VGAKVREIGSILKAKLGWILPSNRKNISENLGNFIFIVFGKDWEFNKIIIICRGGFC
jgi:hypothetical protein